MKFVVISVGSHAIKNVLPSLKACNNLELVATCSRSEISGYETCVPNYPTTEKLLDSKIEFEAAIICSPNAIHFEQALALLISGKHLLVEKRAFMNESEFLEVSKIAKERGLIIKEAFMYRCHEHLKKLKNIYDESTYGEAAFVDIEFTIPHLNYDNIRYSKDLGGGALNDLGAYTLNLARLLTNDDINLLSSSIFHGERSVDLKGWAQLAYRDVMFNCKWGFGVSYQNKIKIISDRYCIYSDRVFTKSANYKPSIIIEKDLNISEVIEIEGSNHFQNLYNEFKDDIRNEKTEQNLTEIQKQLGLMEKVRQDAKRL